MPFLFSKSMAERATKVSKRLLWEKPSTETLHRSKEAFDYFCQQYGGLGFIASFLPWTQAFKARMLLSDEVDRFSKHVRERLMAGSLELMSEKMSLYGPILGSILSMPFKLTHEITSGPFIYFDENKKKPFLKLLSLFPIVKDIKKDIKKNEHGSNLIHTLCNPVRILEDFLFFLNQLANRVIETGSEQNSKPGLGRKFLKGAVGVLFTVINIPVKTVSAITDIPYQVLKNGVFEPLKFLATAWENKAKTKGEDGVIIKSEDFDLIQTKLRQQMGRGVSTSVIMQDTIVSTESSSRLTTVDFNSSEDPTFFEKANQALDQAKPNGFVLFKATSKDVREMKKIVKEVHRERAGVQPH